MFYEEFLLKEPNHLGIYFSFEKGKSRHTWIGMVDPPVFYLIDEIKLEAFQRYKPTKTTEQRWNRFLFLFRLQHPREEGSRLRISTHCQNTEGEKIIQLVHESQSNVLDINEKSSCSGVQRRVQTGSCLRTCEPGVLFHEGVLCASPSANL